MKARYYSAPETEVIEVDIERRFLDVSRNTDNNEKPRDTGEDYF